MAGGLFILPYSNTMSLIPDMSAQEIRVAPGLNRPAMLRIYEILRIVNDGGFPNCTSLADDLEVTPKTVQRDISFMRDSLNLPIEYDGSCHGYYFRESIEDFPIFEVGAEELAALFLTRVALDSVNSAKMREDLRRIFGELTKRIEGTVRFSWAEALHAFSRKPASVTKSNMQLFGKLAKAAIDRNTVTFAYRKLGAESRESRTLHPLHLGEVEGCWYVIGHDPDRDGLRTFALPRITGLKVAKKCFDPPEGFDGDAYLQRSFGIWTSPDNEPLQVVRIELTGYAAALADERRWHPSQQVERLNAKGTRVEVRFEVGRIEELVRWVLSWGRLAKVIAPKELKNRVADEIKAMGGK